MIPTLPTAQGDPLHYPQAPKGQAVDERFGRRIADPYRWLEDPNSAETRDWVIAENRLTFGYLDALPGRERLRQRLTTLWNYERFSPPSREGGWYIYSRNDGLQNQAVVYRTTSLDATGDVLLDPNTLSADGTVALGSLHFTDDGRLVAYSVAASGSDWLEWRVRDVATGADLPDVVKWSKFSGAAWLKDGSGFYYSRYDAPKEGEAFTGVNTFQKVYFHRLGTAQDADALVFERRDHPDWGFGATVTEDGRFLLIYQSEGTKPENRVFVQDLSQPGSAIRPFLDRFDAEYAVVGNDGARFYVQTDKDAPRRRLVAVDLARPEASAWTTLIPEAPGRDVLAATAMVANRLVTQWMVDAHDVLRVYGRDGTFQREIALPGIGSVSGLTGRRRDPETFFGFSSFADPGTIYRHDVDAGRSTVFRQPKVAFTPSDFETVQVFYPSKDGTTIPMFLTYRRGLTRDGNNPTYLYGYGGFDISLTPAFSPALIAWMESGGIFAQANLRGGGEYGRAWYDAGRLHRKQNVFDDFIAAAEYLIRERYTSTPKLAIAGGSNGGLLVGACLTQRPDLFGAAVPAVGVMDMLRFDQFTIGWAWKSDYGDPAVQADFEMLLTYSPLHNIRPGTAYPPTLITTSDHDDRVAPAHSFKFAAALQAAQAGPAPILIRIETKAGHGAGKPTTKIIEERADVYAFVAHELGVQLKTP
jgi:prolyl oligopeptidase